MTRSFTEDEAFRFMTYFNIADEIWPRPDNTVTLSDMDRRAVQEARSIAKELELAWPPDLPEAEEYLLCHGPAVRHALDWRKQ